MADIMLDEQEYNLEDTMDILLNGDQVLYAVGSRIYVATWESMNSLPSLQQQ